MLHKDDNPADYPREIFTNDPNTWTPNRKIFQKGDDYYNYGNMVYKWGLILNFDEECDGTGYMRCNMKQQENMMGMRYPGDIFGEGLQNPLLQFITVLAEREVEMIKTESVQSLMDAVFIIKISLIGLENDCWRRIKVPASTPLHILHDQIIIPTMGWSRGYHGYYFRDNSDGATFGPKKNSQYIDMMHVKNHCHFLADDRHVPLALLLRKVTDACYYVYDIGDTWKHEILVEAIIRPGEADSSDGFSRTVEILSGSGACPPEDSMGLSGMGNDPYVTFINEFKKNPKNLNIRKAVAGIQTAINYSKNWLTNAPIPYRPLEYDLDFHRRQLSSMIQGPTVN